MAEAKRRVVRQDPSALIDFLMNATDDQKAVIEYFRNAEPAEAEVALGVAKTIVKRRAGGSGASAAPRASRSATKTSGGTRTRRRVVNSGTEQEGDKSAGAAAAGPAAESAPARGSRRVIGGE